ncbi:hypothetical protein B6S44_26800 [Bosea sp. Tri-44]|uniref:acyltransferase family protein n=1 Tax=Bosea sp. Tri-44 TaxID=1972137 RepID=UPI00100E3BD8|nr:acyltransferase [Bosea sp. Tri-44]RXT46417.1 hypothetical protein B6S44_26800 [Bosea sp. Tri-44]
MRPNRIAGYYGVDAVPGFLGRASDLSHTHLPELTGLRGVAILIVVIGHLLQRVERFYGREALSGMETLVLGILATPFSGCRLLFCITGFTMIIYIEREAKKHSKIDDLNLLKNRLTRLWPPYFIVLFGTFTFISLTGFRPEGTYQFYAAPDSLILSFLASSLYVHDLVFDTFPRLFPPGWFLEVHFQFLIVGPALWRFYLRASERNGRAVTSLLFLSATVLIAIIAESYGSRGIQYSLLAFLPYFVIGALMAELGASGRSRALDLTPAAKWPIGSLGVLALILLGTPCGAIWWQLPAQLIAIAAIMLACLTGQSTFRRTMSNRALARIGTASFSIYLIHLQILQVTMPIVVEHYRHLPFFALVLICTIVGLVLVLVLSLGFYWLVERPCVALSLDSKRWRSRTARFS